MSARLRARGDAGMTMIELMVSMSIMGMVAAIVTSGLTQLYRATNDAETDSVAQSQISAALLRLDKQVRYARRIHRTSATSMTYEVVEMAVSRCYETALSSQKLQQRGKVVGGSYGSWSTLASGITGGGFTYLAPTDLNDHQRLQVQLTAQSAGGSAATKDFDLTFTALNTTRTSDTNAC
jgi:prepilin-type N-terminal cleavage/methylation domain-containing protein